MEGRKQKLEEGEGGEVKEGGTVYKKWLEYGITE